MAFDLTPPIGGPAPSILEAYDPERFSPGRSRADRPARGPPRALPTIARGVVVPWQAPEVARAAWGKEPLGQVATGELVADLARFVAASTAPPRIRTTWRIRSRRPCRARWLAETAAALTNNGMAVYEMGPAAAPIELAVIAFLAAKLGYPATAGGLFTSGGSLGKPDCAARDAPGPTPASTCGTDGAPRGGRRSP